MQETWVQSLVWEDPLNKVIATHSSILAWEILWTEEPGRLQSAGLQRVGHDLATEHTDTNICVSFVLLNDFYSCLPNSFYFLGFSFSYRHISVYIFPYIYFPFTHLVKILFGTYKWNILRSPMWLLFSVLVFCEKCFIWLYSNCHITIATKHCKWIKPPPVFFFLVLLPFAFCCIYSQARRFCVFSFFWDSFSCVQPPLLI